MRREDTAGWGVGRLVGCTQTKHATTPTTSQVELAVSLRYDLVWSNRAVFFPLSYTYHTFTVRMLRSGSASDLLLFFCRAKKEKSEGSMVCAEKTCVFHATKLTDVRPWFPGLLDDSWAVSDHEGQRQRALESPCRTNAVHQLTEKEKNTATCHHGTVQVSFFSYSTGEPPHVLAKATTISYTVPLLLKSITGR